MHCSCHVHFVVKPHLWYKLAVRFLNDIFVSSRQANMGSQEFDVIVLGAGAALWTDFVSLGATAID